MKKLLTFLLLLWLAGSILSCEGQLKQKLHEENSGYSIEVKQQQAELETGRIASTNIPGVDFRFAARKVTPGVVHVNSTWKSEDQNKSRDNDPFRDFFGEEFWHHFFDPFHQQGPLQASASGVIITSDGYIITNNHVIDDAVEIDVVLYDQRSYKAKVIGTDSKTDLALIKIEETNLAFIAYGNSDNVEVGEWVLAVGNPFNLASTVTAGIVSAKARNINILRDREAVESFIQTDAAVNPGNSGGALVNLAGQLIGINSAIATPTGTYAGYSFAIPVNLVKKVADDLLKFGTVKRGYLGVIIRDMTGSLANSLNLKFITGVYVDSLLENSAAAAAGIKPGDIIIKIDDIVVGTSPQLQEIVAKHRPGEKLLVTVVRNDAEKEITVILKEASSVPAPTKKDEASVLKILGIDVLEISTEEKRKYDLQNGLKVIRITKGKIKEYTTMKAGFIITKVNKTAVRTKNDLIMIIQNEDGGIMIEGIYPGSKEVFYYGFGI